MLLSPLAAPAGYDLIVRFPEEHRSNAEAISAVMKNPFSHRDRRADRG
jgi:hypothetical protein